MGADPCGSTLLWYWWICSVASEKSVSLHSERSVRAPWLTCPWMSTAALVGVKVPSVAKVETLGNSPPVATNECFGERFASTRENELNHLLVRSSFSGRLGTSLVP